MYMRVIMSKLFSLDNPHLRALLLRRADDKLSTELDGETVILDIASGIYSGLDPVGTTIWNLLADKVTFQAIVTEILSTYDVEEEQCTADLCEFLSSLAESGLIVAENAEHP